MAKDLRKALPNDMYVTNRVRAHELPGMSYDADVASYDAQNYDLTAEMGRTAGEAMRAAGEKSREKRYARGGRVMNFKSSRKPGC